MGTNLEEAKTKTGPKKELGISVYLGFFADYVYRTGMKEYAFGNLSMLIIKTPEGKKASFQRPGIIDWGKDADDRLSFKRIYVQSIYC